MGWNLATKAPNITPEIAREFQRRSIESRKARIKREREILAAANAALARKPDDDTARTERLKRQIDCLLDDMEKAKSFDRRKEIAGTIADVWKLVQSVPGATKAGRRSSAPPSAVPIGPATPQAAAVPPAGPAPV